MALERELEVQFQQLVQLGAVPAEVLKIPTSEFDNRSFGELIMRQ